VEPPPAILLWQTSWLHTMQRYPGGGLLAISWDTGAAIQTAYLLSEANSLAGCACAGLPLAEHIQQLGWDPGTHAFVGAFALGIRPPQAP
jgi:hypothetical protein